MTSKTPFTSLIVAVYKNTQYLRMVLLSIERQSFKDFELIVAEDDEDPNMKSFIEKSQKEFSFPIIHVHQPDNGFRKNAILNTAVKISKGEFLQFIDGDSVLQEHYLKCFAKQAEPGICLFGRRVYLDEQFTNKLIQEDSLRNLTLMNVLLSKSEQKKHALYMPWVLPFQKNKNGIWGCSMGLMKEDLLAVNGFDEDYVKVGVGEDFDLEWRLLKNGVKLKSLKYYARQYHLHHERHDREDDVRFNFELMWAKQKEGIVFCGNGIVKQTEKSKVQ